MAVKGLIYNITAITVKHVGRKARTKPDKTATAEKWGQQKTVLDWGKGGVGVGGRER